MSRRSIGRMRERAFHGGGVHWVVERRGGAVGEAAPARWGRRAAADVGEDGGALASGCGGAPAGRRRRRHLFFLSSICVFTPGTDERTILVEMLIWSRGKTVREKNILMKKAQEKKYFDEKCFAIATNGEKWHSSERPHLNSGIRANPILGMAFERSQFLTVAHM